MRSLVDLLTDPAGIAFLEQRGLHLDPVAFAHSLRPPRRPELAQLLGVDPGGSLVYIGQQVCADMGPSTVAKFAAAPELARDHDLTLAILWHDLDSTQSERYGARIVLPSGRKQKGVWLAPRALEDLEPRFIEVERERLEEVVAFLRTWVHGACRSDPAAARERVARLAEALLAPEISNLAQANRALSSFLLREQLQLDPPSVLASEMLARGLLVDSVTEYVARIDEVVSVFNGAVQRLVAADIDPRVRTLADDYLPLWFACPKDGTRLRLKSKRSGTELLGTATCRCETSYAFSFGRDRPDLSELIATGRWGIDVSMPVHHNELASGWLSGRSSALYALVFNEVIERVLGQTPIPVLVPPSLTSGAPSAANGQATLLLHYLTGTPMHAEVALA